MTSSVEKIQANWSRRSSRSQGYAPPRYLIICAWHPEREFRGAILRPNQDSDLNCVSNEGHSMRTRGAAAPATRAARFSIGCRSPNLLRTSCRRLCCAG